VKALQRVKNLQLYLNCVSALPEKESKKIHKTARFEVNNCHGILLLNSNNDHEVISELFCNLLLL